MASLHRSLGSLPAPGGRLGLVLPAELLTVNYAADVRRLLMEHFGNVRLVLFTERVFPGVQEEVVLMLADQFDPAGVAGTDHCEIYQVQDAASLEGVVAPTRWIPSSPSATWSVSIMRPNALEVFADMLRRTEFVGSSYLRWG